MGPAPADQSVSLRLGFPTFEECPLNSLNKEDQTKDEPENMKVRGVILVLGVEMVVLMFFFSSLSSTLPSPSPNSISIPGLGGGPS